MILRPRANRGGNSESRKDTGQASPKSTGKDRGAPGYSAQDDKGAGINDALTVYELADPPGEFTTTTTVDSATQEGTPALQGKEQDNAQEGPPHMQAKQSTQVTHCFRNYASPTAATPCGQQTRGNPYLHNSCCTCFLFSIAHPEKSVFSMLADTARELGLDEVQANSLFAVFEPVSRVLVLEHSVQAAECQKHRRKRKRRRDMNYDSIERLCFFEGTRDVPRGTACEHVNYEMYHRLTRDLFFRSALLFHRLRHHDAVLWPEGQAFQTFVQTALTCLAFHAYDASEYYFYGLDSEKKGDVKTYSSTHNVWGEDGPAVASQAPAFAFSYHGALHFASTADLGPLFRSLGLLACPTGCNCDLCG